jgi:hypothetical protein
MRISDNSTCKGRGADEPRELGLGLDLLGHQVQQPDPKRADILTVGRLLPHDLNPLAAEDGKGGQGGGQLDRHRSGLCPLREGQT